jgi:Cupin superfamily protein
VTSTTERLGTDHDCDALALLLGPHSAKQFFTSYWEDAPLHVTAASNPILQTVLPTLASLIDLDELLAATYAVGRRAWDSVRMTQAGTEIPPENFLSEHRGDLARVDVDRVLALHRQGATLVLNSVHQLHRPISDLCRQLAHRFGLSTHANVYVTPPDGQGFGPHYDTHDVFMIQLAGGKTWQITPSSEPMRLTEFRSDDTEKAVHGGIGVRLRAGDVLYIPRGMFHEGHTSSQLSAHLTIGVHPYTWAHLLRALIERITDADVDFRRCVPHAAGTSFPYQSQQAGFTETLAILTARLNNAWLAEKILGERVANLTDSQRAWTDRSGQLAAVWSEWQHPRHDVTSTADTTPQLP